MSTVLTKSRRRQATSPTIERVVAGAVAAGIVKVPAIARQTGLSARVVHTIMAQPGFVDVLARHRPGLLTAQTLDHRLNRVAHEALTILAEEMRTSTDGTIRLQAATALWRAYEATRPRRPTPVGDSPGLPAEALPVIVETWQQLAERV